MVSSSSREHQRRRETTKKSARKGSGGGILEMAKEGQTTSRLGSQSVFNSVQEVGWRRMVVWKGGRAAFKEDRSPWVVDLPKSYDKSGGSEEGLAYFLRLESEFEKKEGSCLEETFGRGWWQSCRRASQVFMSLGRNLASVRVRLLQGDRTPCITPQVRVLEVPCRTNDITCANELQNINGR